MYPLGDVCIHQLMDDLFGPLDHVVGHARQLGYLNAVALVCAALDDLSQENDIVAFFFYGDAVIVHAGQFSFQLCQFMVVSGKQRLGPQKSRVADVLHHCPGNGQAVEGAGASANLVQNEQAVGRGVAQNVSHLGHLHHERTLAGRQVVGRTYPGKDPVHNADLGFLGRDKAADLCHKHNEGSLPHIGGFSGHVWAGDDGNPVLVVVQISVIGDEHIVGDHFFHHRMSARPDVNESFLVDGRTHIIFPLRHQGKGRVHVQSGDGPGRFLDPQHFPADLIPHVGKEIVFQRKQLILGTQDHVFQLLELRGNVAFRVGQRLLAHIVVRHQILIGIGHFQIIAEHLVVFDTEVLDAGALPLLLL